jgi:AcrR family transcriptional regulator
MATVGVDRTSVTSPPLQVRRRRLMQGEIERTALRLFLDKGYDAVSIDDIAAAVGMSGRTFFRYYATKDEILRRFQAGLNDALVDAFQQRPADEGALRALRAAFAVTSHVAKANRERVRALGRLLASVPAVHARSMGETLLDDRLAAEFARRSHARRADARPAFVVAAVSAAALIGWNRWVGSDDTPDPSTVVTHAIDVLGLSE